jgi:hypothetical protein
LFAVKRWKFYFRTVGKKYEGMTLNELCRGSSGPINKNNMEKLLSNFGEQFIKSVRDNTLFVLEGIISGHMKSDTYKLMHQEIIKMPEVQVALLRDLAYRMVDLSLHNILFMFENNADWTIAGKSGGVNDINTLSDGLAGELYSEDGWINQFSGYPKSKRF